MGFVMANSKIEKDIRIEFKNFDQAVLLGVDDVKQIIGAKSAASVYAQVYRGDLPEPLIKKNRQLRWSVGQLREHLQGLDNDFRKRQSEGAAASGDEVPPATSSKRIGRARDADRPFS